MAAFGGFTFLTAEAPQLGSYLDWVREPEYARALPIGANRHDIQNMGLGSSRLEFISYMTKARYDTARALMGTVATFTGWDGTARSALLEQVNVAGWAAGNFSTATYFVRFALCEV